VKQKKVNDTYVRIWKTVSRIPEGKVASYGTIARVSGFPMQPRLAGYALHNIPGGLDIPWHRVINAAGRISLPGTRGEEQERLLNREGVYFTRGRVSMDIYGWRPAARGRKKRSTS